MLSSQIKILQSQHPQIKDDLELKKSLRFHLESHLKSGQALWNLLKDIETTGCDPQGSIQHYIETIHQYSQLPSPSSTSISPPSGKLQLFNPLSLQVPALSDLSQVPSQFHPIYRQISDQKYSQAWNHLILLCGQIIPGKFDSILLKGLVTCLSLLLPFLSINSRSQLVSKVMEPLRKNENFRNMECFVNLEIAVARWLSSSHLKDGIEKEKWHQELYLPILKCYDHVLTELRIRATTKETIYVESSRVLVNAFFNYLPRLGTLIQLSFSRTKGQNWKIFYSYFHYFKRIFAWIHQIIEKSFHFSK